MTKYRVGRDSDESRTGKGRAENKWKVSPYRTGYLQNPDKEQCRVSIRNNY